ncbi:MBL fold metallo-hydrolase [Bartonella melophagi]|uniref:Metallo-beta-lactamase domain-containing protein n=1 Tax=Bartonella melophagi K-2C TaxID=1094557 RepID=J0R6U4_9HYPH|nr:MBL fold metallo-hydrolase [Bartonella melophagi]EJF91414.1 hypothetical protein ME3_00480 [Bartonella melophagi K-2C]
MSNLSAHIIPVTSFQQNCTLLFDDKSKKGVLVDPGGDWPKIQAAIQEVDVIVEAIWITHGHVDHVGAAMQAKEELNVKIIGSHRGDQPVMEDVVERAKVYRMPDVRICVPDQWLEDGDSVDCAGHVFDVLHIPGHTPGHVIYFNKKKRLALVGDVLFRGSIGRTDFPLSSHEELMKSIEEKVLPLGDDVSFISGHGPESTINYERRFNPFLQGI